MRWKFQHKPNKEKSNNKMVIGTRKKFKVGIRGCKIMSWDKDTWKLILKEARVQHAPQSHGEEKWEQKKCMNKDDGTVFLKHTPEYR
jgi:hypothetical protein